MSVQVGMAGAVGAAQERARPRRALAVLQRAWGWLALEPVEGPSAQQRDFLARTMRLAPLHWR